AQINTRVGDFDGNARRVLKLAQHAARQHPDAVCVFPELTLSGYPPEDLLLRPSLERRVQRALELLCRELPPDIVVVLGYPARRGGVLLNLAAIITGGMVVSEYAKRCLPNYQVFDEKRYFAPGTESVVVPLQGVPVALSICEDIWEPQPIADAAAAGARLVLNLNSSPYHRGKQAEREALVAMRAQSAGVPVVYVNQVGGQDELVFDGGSFAVDASGTVGASAPRFVAAEHWVRIAFAEGRPAVVSGASAPQPADELDATWRALVMGLRDYVDKNGFPGVVLGLSGGIDSALTLALAVDALGAERVHAIMMPFRYTAAMSIEDAAEQSRLLGVRHSVISIEPIYESFMQSLSEAFAGRAPDTTEENLQARCRGVILMSISNKLGSLVLTTGNKSELAVGYSTLYGDMAGGFDPIKDVPKTLVYELCRFRNRRGHCIPERVIERPPSAELAPDQKDEDSLPAYPVLDAILERYIEGDESADDIVAGGFQRADVERVVRLVDRNEYKRRQAPIGVRITRRGFGRDRRYPITSAWVVGD
ncbi:MAG: NAD+ synthase, partial [Chromatocurvus sp.]